MFLWWLCLLQGQNMGNRVVAEVALFSPSWSFMEQSQLFSVIPYSICGYNTQNITVKNVSFPCNAILNSVLLHNLFPFSDKNSTNQPINQPKNPKSKNKTNRKQQNKTNKTKNNPKLKNLHRNLEIHS